MQKKECYPIKESIEITDTSAEIKYQYLLNRTAMRLLQVVIDVLEVQNQGSIQNLILILGMDRSAQSEYKQRFSDLNSKDANIFISSLVPIRLISNERDRQHPTFSGKMKDLPRHNTAGP